MWKILVLLNLNFSNASLLGNIVPNLLQTKTSRSRREECYCWWKLELVYLFQWHLLESKLYIVKEKLQIFPFHLMHNAKKLPPTFLTAEKKPNEVAAKKDLDSPCLIKTILWSSLRTRKSPISFTSNTRHRGFLGGDIHLEICPTNHPFTVNSWHCLQFVLWMLKAH